MRFLFRRPAGLLLINLTAVAQVYWTTMVALISIFIVSASGSLYSDIVKAQSGEDRETPFFLAYCKPLELNLWIATLSIDYKAKIDDLKPKVDRLRRERAHVHRDPAFYVDTRLELTDALLDYRMIEVLQKEEELASDDMLEAWKAYSTGVVLIGIIIIAAAVWPLWNLLFIGTALRSDERRRGLITVFAKVATLTLVSGAALYIYVMAAEGTPVWLGDDLSRQKYSALAKLEWAETYCGTLERKVPGYGAMR